MIKNKDSHKKMNVLKLKIKLIQDMFENYERINFIHYQW